MKWGTTQSLGTHHRPLLLKGLDVVLPERVLVGKHWSTSSRNILLSSLEQKERAMRDERYCQHRQAWRRVLYNQNLRLTWVGAGVWRVKHLNSIKHLGFFFICAPDASEVIPRMRCMLDAKSVQITVYANCLSWVWLKAWDFQVRSRLQAWPGMCEAATDMQQEFNRNVLECQGVKQVCSKIGII